MSYLVLARKYRPQSFDDLVGQSHVATTLANAIAQDRVAHAFLFTGVRGVGKTTSARLLAKCLNCLGKDGKATGPTATPCQVCAACTEIAQGNDIDVQEIDGASYNGVDEVRRLQEGLAFRPARDRFKIYIVDEVHMLSNAAWNAFLKTLEEPPPHVKFIFATTEVHKVPVTILSRCQRYDFKLISSQMIGARLKEVLTAEKIKADDTAIAVLAREAAGSMRDAMSLLDQVIAFSGNKLSSEDVTRVLGVADRQVLHDLCAALIAGDAPKTLTIIDQIASQGFDLSHIAKDILRHLRNLVVAKVCGADGRELLDLADEEVKDTNALAEKSNADDLVRLYQGFSRGFDDIVRSGQPRASLEMTLVRLARRPPLLPIDDLLSRLGELERRLASGTPPPSGPRPGGSPASGGGSARSSFGGSAGGGAPGGGGRSAPKASDMGERTRGSLALADEPHLFQVPEVVLRPPPQPVPAARPQAKPAPAPPQPVGEVDLDAWRSILDSIRKEDAGLAASLEHASPLEVSRDRLLLGYESHSLFGEQASDAEALDHIKRAARKHFQHTTEVAIDLSLKASMTTTIASLDLERRKSAQGAARAKVENHPLVAKALSLFGGELRDVKLPPQED